MKKRVSVEALSLHEVPEELDRKILLTAAFCARHRVRQRRFRRIFAAAASILFVSGAVFTGFQVFPGRAIPHPERNVLSQKELLKLSDWSELEQENYNMELQLNSGRQAFSELALNRL